MPRRIARVQTVSADLNRVQQNVADAVEPLAALALQVQRTTTKTVGATLKGYALVAYDGGTFWIPVYSEPTS